MQFLNKNNIATDIYIYIYSYFNNSGLNNIKKYRITTKNLQAIKYDQ